MHSLGTLSGNAHTSIGLAINDAGQIAGHSYLDPNSLVSHPFLYSNGTMIDLGTLGAMEVVTPWGSTRGAA